MSPNNKPPTLADRYRLTPEQLRWRCDPKAFGFRTTREIGDCPIDIIGQPRAVEALEVGLAVRGEGYNIFVTGDVGSGRSTVVRRSLAEIERGKQSPPDLIFVQNFHDPDQPRLLSFPSGRGSAFRQAMQELVASLGKDLPALYESAPYTKRRTSMREATAQAQKERLKEFEKDVQEQGFTLVQVQVGTAMAPQLLPVIAGNPTEMDQLESLVERGQFNAKDFETIKRRLTGLRTEMESLAKQLRNMDRDLHRRLDALDRELARPLVQDAVADLRAAFETEGLSRFLEELTEDLLDHLEELREREDVPAAASGDGRSQEPALRSSRYEVNVVVDNSRTGGAPIIWETAPNYRNLFGTIDAVRTGGGDWSTDHTRIRAGSLLRANGGILVLDAMDVLVEPGVWAALKRSLRNRRVEIQAFDPLHFLAGLSLKPEPAPIDVKVVLIGTRFIYRVLFAHDEDFKKIFKVKADFALHTPLSEAELRNYACFVHKKVQDDGLLPFHREAVAAVVEQGARLAGDRNKLTTRFTEIADLIRESGYWARRDKARWVREEHVDRAIAKRTYRVDLIEEMLRERIASGEVLLDLEGDQVGQVNGLAVLDLGDHVFAQPTRITATTAMGRVGIINIDREAEMSGAIHTKGVLILAGFLRARFAQRKPLTLTASLCFEQSYGPIDGDSASAAELYALLSCLAGVPIRQAIAVTGSVNQNGEIQPIGAVNEKIEGYFELCRLQGLTGSQGVLIPDRNLPHLMLRKEVVDAVRAGRFHVWAVATVQQGLEVLTGLAAGEPDAGGRYPDGTIFARVDAELSRLAEQVSHFGFADHDPTT